MVEAKSTDKDLSSFQKILLVCLTIFLVIVLFFFRNGFKEKAILDQLAQKSILPEQALSNGKPTVLEFYADWCEACKEMAPDMIDLKNININKVDVVLLNVDNTRWIDLINKYDVNGIPQLIFFDGNGDYQGLSLGVRKYNELEGIFSALIDNSKLPSFTGFTNSSKLISYPSSKDPVLDSNIISLKTSGPRDHN